MKLGIVVPCYNEAKRLDQKAFLEFLQREGEDTLFCFVNDGSWDETGRILEDMAQKVTIDFLC